MSRTVVVEFPLPVAGNVLRAVRQAIEEVGTYHNTEKAEDNYNKGCKYAYLDCARTILEEAINEG